MEFPIFMEASGFIDEKGTVYNSALFDTYWGYGDFFCSIGC